MSPDSMASRFEVVAQPHHLALEAEAEYTVHHVACRQKGARARHDRVHHFRPFALMQEGGGE